MKVSRRSFLASPVALCAAADLERGLRLWYRQPAQDWNEALPIGNGHLGAMIFGGIAEDHLQLNENTLYSDEPGRRDLPLDVSADFERVVSLLRAGDYAEAGEIITRKWCGRAQPCYQPLGDLHLGFENHSAASDYERELDLSQALCSVRYKSGGAAFQREYFASHPDRALVVRLTADGPAALTFRARLSSVHPTAKAMADGQDTIVLAGQAPGLALRRTLEWVEERGDQWKYPELWDKDGRRRPNAKPVLYGGEIGGLGMRFEARLKAIPVGGSVSASEAGLAVKDAREVLLLLTAATSYNGFDKSPSREGADQSALAREALARASRRSYSALREAHVADYKNLFDRVSINLGAGGGNLPTPERVTRSIDVDDPGLAALYFQFGRYLMIAGSRPGGQPLNLQGLWNPHVIPPWAGAYTTNINTEMNYWLAEVANLSECHEPLMRMLTELTVTGGEVARKMYQRRGWVEHHNTTIWRDAQPVDNDARPSFWPSGGAWLATHAWEHYLFTGDRDFLARQGYPILKGAAEFLADWLVDDGKGHLVTAASNSPEIDFVYEDRRGEKRTAGVSMGPTMDLGIVRHLFGACIEAAQLLGRDPALRNELKAKLDKLLPYQVGRRGQLQEWPADFPESDPRHRHVSHLFALHPSNQLTPRTPDLFVAALRSLELRGDGGTGWSRAWKINFWARLLDGNHAHLLVRNLLQLSRTAQARMDRGGVYPNLLCSHPPFQIDGNFGGAAGIAEMLLQSHAGEIRLLPALPRAWPDGQVRGLRARGAFQLDFAWQARNLLWAELRSLKGNPCNIRYGQQTRTFETKPGATYRLDENMKLTAKTSNTPAGSVAQGPR